MKRDSKFELMAPAGSYPALAAAIRAGADSVYFGIDQLNMRSRAATPFTLKDLHRITRICRWCGVQSYLALNVLVYDEELPTIQEICEAAKSAQIDAIIASDIAVIQHARALGLKIHISVQANVSNLESVRFYAQYAEVIVLARELTIEQISKISKKIQEEKICGPSGKLLRIELFAHGALCVAVSGKCYMSLGVYNQSANRGSCFQNCRRKYRIIDAETGDELEIQNQFVMSPKDLCTIQHLDRLANAGVSIFKLEGRARPAHYVSITTQAYRLALNALTKKTYCPEDFSPQKMKLNTVFNRGFWDGGYYCGKKLGDWAASGHSQATHKRIQLGIISNYFSRIGIAEFTLWQESLFPNSKLLIEGPTTGCIQTTAQTLRVEGQPANQAKKGDRVTLPVPAKVRRNDKIFWLKPAHPTEL